MKGAVSIKSILIVVILVLVGVFGVLGVNTAKTYMSGASADTEPKNVLAKPSGDGKSATVSWVSDKAVVGIVEYGTTPASLLLRAPESDQTVSHAVVLSPLKANTNYYFRIRVGEEVFDNSGIPYSFKTKVGGEDGPIPTKAKEVTPTLVDGECQRGVDYNKDGTTNSLDYIECLKKKTTPTAGQSGGQATPTTASKCKQGVDYNKDGTVNSLDWIKCLQSQ
ncbi:MAG: fibronectin type III domain-containing protein [Patescibacteria group bacterium]